MRFFKFLAVLVSFFILPNITFSQVISEDELYNNFVQEKDSVEETQITRNEKRTIKYYPDGAIKSVEFYKKGKPHGNWKQFWPNGVIYSEVELDEGDKVGEWKFYNREGKLIGVSEYADNRLIGAYYFNPEDCSVIKWK